MASRVLFKTTRPAAASFVASRQAAAAAVAAQRPFSASPASLSYKESSHNDESRDPEKHKQDLLAKHKAGKGHWKPELASDSEEAVKADRAHRDGGGDGAQQEDIAKLQERTKSTAEDTAKSGTSMRDGL